VSTRLQQHVQKLRLIWAVMLVSLGTYALIGLLAPAPAEAARPANPAVVWVLGVLAAAILLAVAPVYHAMLDRARRGFGTEQRLEPVFFGHLAALTVAWTQVESVGVLGLAVLFITRRPEVFWTFLAVSATGLLVLRPTTDAIDDLVSSAPSGTLPIEP
jgi:hypothetical protein